MFYVYIIHSKKKSGLYVGMTINLKRRIKEHNTKQHTSTKAHTPWGLVYYEAHTIQDDAIRREKYLKTTQGNQAIKSMLRSFFKHLENQGSTTG